MPLFTHYPAEPAKRPFTRRRPAARTLSPSHAIAVQFTAAPPVARPRALHRRQTRPSLHVPWPALAIAVLPRAPPGLARGRVASCHSSLVPRPSSDPLCSPPPCAVSRCLAARCSMRYRAMPWMQVVHPPALPPFTPRAMLG
ncbi:hypothetical protein K505DRAFT_130132 [Melanomma pulvis-pyrius CBS 109.77]|uniref:Uncharacterized protein n=1 Tax=Melanomma pulvis-pyrius CBS 109.77 TaxID=1314802 RepID=A0A6A6WT06_9PLEO|nr:hypothetical protein K505DRAFT_130132 [Melanomma pulvis-pyrius CBS 109.77]